MTKKHFIALADFIREHEGRFPHDTIDLLADFCASLNPRFDRERWLGYIAGENGPCGGKRKRLGKIGRHVCGG